MRITYLFNSGFVIETPEADILFDYTYGNYTPKPDHKLYIFVSHSHGDHYNPYIWQMNGENTIYLLDSNVHKHGQAYNIHVMDKGDVYADENISAQCLGGIERGASFLAQIGDRSIFHAGGLNNWHWNEENSPQEVQKAEASYERELEIITEQTDHVNIAFFPIDPRLGKDYMKGAIQFLDVVKADVFLPMHFRENFQAANAFEPFAAERGAKFIKIEAPGVVYEE